MMNVGLTEAHDVLNRVFGHADFRGLQAEVIAEVLAGRNALAVLPTGGGKSVCYQIPAMLRGGVGPGGLPADRPDERPGRGVASGRGRRRPARTRARASTNATRRGAGCAPANSISSTSRRKA